MLKESGYEVTGSDQNQSQFALDLQKLGIPIYIGHHARNIGAADWVVMSSAVKADNPEVIAAKHTAPVGTFASISGVGARRLSLRTTG